MPTRNAVAVAVAFCIAGIGAQNIAAQRRDDSALNDHTSRTRAIDESDSRVQKEAEQLVSLPSEKIILLLEQEPGLFLEVKKMLVRRAYSQGRVIDPKELTDESIFR